MVADVKTPREVLAVIESQLRQRSFSAGGLRTKVDLLHRVVAIFEGCSWDNQQLVPLVTRSLLVVLREHLFDTNSSVRAAALRACRYLLVSDAALGLLVALRVPHFVAGRLDGATSWERICALKLVRRWLLLAAEGCSKIPVPRVFIISLVGIAEHWEDDFRISVVQTLRDVAVWFPELVGDCRGFLVLVDALVEPAVASLVPSIVPVILHVLNEPQTREYLLSRQAISFSRLFAVFTNTDIVSRSVAPESFKDGSPPPTKEKQRELQWQAARRAVVLLMQNVTGLILLASDPQGLFSLVQVLGQPIEVPLKLAILELFEDVIEQTCGRHLCAGHQIHRRFVEPSCPSAPPLPTIRAAMTSHTRRLRAYSTMSDPSATGEPLERSQSPYPLGSPGPPALTPSPEKNLIRRSPSIVSASLLQDEPERFQREESALGGSGEVSQKFPEGRFLQAALVYPCQTVRLHEVYAVLALRVLICAGLPEALTCTCVETGDDRAETSSKGTKLLSTILHLAGLFLPDYHSKELHQLPRVIAVAASFGNLRQRACAESVLSGLRATSSNFSDFWDAEGMLGVLGGGPGYGCPSAPDFFPSAMCATDDVILQITGESHSDFEYAIEFARNVASGSMYAQLLTELQDVPSIGSAMKVDEFHANLKQTGILNYSKDDSKWDWKLIYLLVTGPLREPAKLQEALNTEFVKRLLKFFSPRRSSFASIEWKTQNLHLVRVGLILVGLILGHPGARQQFLEPNGSLFYSHCFSSDLAGMLQHELNDAQEREKQIRPLTPGSVGYTSAPIPMSAPLASCGTSAPASGQSDTSEVARSQESLHAEESRCPSSDESNPSPNIKTRVRSNSEDTLGKSFTGRTTTSPLGPSRAATPGAESDSGAVLRRNEQNLDQRRAIASLDLHRPSLAAEHRGLTQYLFHSLSSAVGAWHLPGHSTQSEENHSVVGSAHQRWFHTFRPLASLEQSQSSLAREYLAFIGLMSASAAGVEILMRLGVYEKIYGLVSQTSKDYITSMLVPQLHYGIEANRAFIDRVFKHGSSSLQLAAIRFFSLQLEGSQNLPGNPIELVMDTQKDQSHSYMPSHDFRLRRNFSCLSTTSETSKLRRNLSGLSLTTRRPRCNSLTAFSNSPVHTPTLTTPNMSPASASILPLAGTLSPVGSPDPSRKATPDFASPDFQEDPEQERTRLRKATGSFSSERSTPRTSPTPGEKADDAGRMDEDSSSVLPWPWIVEHLTEASKAEDFRVARAACEALQQICRSEEVIHYLLSRMDMDKLCACCAHWPAMLRMRLLQTERGVEVMQQSGFLDKDFYQWVHQDERRYVDLVSILLARGWVDSDEANSSSFGLELPRSPAQMHSSQTQYDWLCRLPWRPLLSIERPSVGEENAHEELLLEAIVERHVPHELRRRMGLGPRSKSGIDIIQAFGELRIVALCSVALDMDSEVRLTPSLGLGALGVSIGEDGYYRASEDRKHLVMIEEIEGTGAIWEHVRAGVVWTFVFPLGNSSQYLLNTISFPLRLPSAEQPALTPPPHMCGFIACTQTGVEYLRQTNFVRDRILTKLGRGEEKERAHEVRAALWSAGHLGQTQFGLELLLEFNVLLCVVRLAMSASRLSLRGTAVYCLAMIGTNPLSVEPLEDLGWDVYLKGPSKTQDIFRMLSLIPEEDDTGAWLPPWSVPQVYSSVPLGPSTGSRGNPHCDPDVWEQDECGEEGTPYHTMFGVAHCQALAQLSSLHNSVVQKDAHATLVRQHMKDPNVFLSVKLWWHTQHQVIAQGYRYPLPVKRFVAELFECTFLNSEALMYLDTLP